MTEIHDNGAHVVAETAETGAESKLFAWGPLAGPLESLLGTDERVTVCTVDGDDTFGKLDEFHEDWLVLFHGGNHYWVNRETITRVFFKTKAVA